MAQSKSGTFTGNGTKAVELQVGFEPDVIVIDSGLNPAEAGYQGLIVVIIAKDIYTFNSVHNSITDTNNSRGYFARIDGWGGSSSVGAYRNIATYANGILTVTNVTANPGATCAFINGQAYTWTAYKA